VKRRVWGAGPVVLFVALGLIAAGGAGSAYAAYRYERAHDSRILPGVKVLGVDVGDMTRGKALAAVRKHVDEVLAQKVTVRAGSRTWRLRFSDLGLRADPANAVAGALRLSRSYSWVARVYHRLIHKPVAHSFDVSFHFDTHHVKKLVNKMAGSVLQPAVDAGIDYVNEQKIEFVHSRTGRAVKKWVSWKRLEAAVEAHQPTTVRFPMETVKPKVTDATLDKTIVVNRTTNMLTLYKGFHVERRYPVATAMQGFLTPPGSWDVINKVENPSWINPCLGQPGCWAASEPAMIPPGPGNPLGTRALYLSAPGIRIHGTPSDDSIGTYASHGCIRMHIPDSEAMYPLVPVGTKVIIMGAPPWGNSSSNQPAG
jgi:lipoprotein-anchoring transpeptidase ErfK/SrfK